MEALGTSGFGSGSEHLSDLETTPRIDSARHASSLEHPVPSPMFSIKDTHDQPGQANSFNGASATAISHRLEQLSPSASSYSSSNTIESTGRDVPLLRPIVPGKRTRVYKQGPTSSLARIQQNGTATNTSHSAWHGKLSPPNSPTSSSTTSQKSPPNRDADWYMVDGIKEHWDKLSEKRSSIRRILDDMRSQRYRVEDFRQEKDKADRTLYASLRKQILQSEISAVEQQVKAAETATLVYQGAQANLDQLTDDLDNAELDLEILEKRFYSKLTRGHTPPPGSDNDESDDEDSLPPSRASLRGISRDRPEDIHPLYSNMKDTLGDLQLAREYLHNLEFKKLALESMDPDLLGREAQDFLKSFDDDRNKTRLEVAQHAEKFEKIRAECHVRKLIPMSSPFFTETDSLRIFLSEEEMTLDGELPDDGNRDALPTIYSTLLSNPRHLFQYSFPTTPKGALKRALALPPTHPAREKLIRDALQEHAIGSLLHDSQPENKNDFINRWLLQRLRLSSMEVEVLYSTFSKVLKVFDFNRWQRDVLSFWSRDKAAQRPLLETVGTSVPSDKRTEPRSEPLSHSASEPLLQHRRSSWDDWDDLGQSDANTKFLPEADDKQSSPLRETL